jgi:hypothetical protein
MVEEIVLFLERRLKERASDPNLITVAFSEPRPQGAISAQFFSERASVWGGQFCRQPTLSRLLCFQKPAGSRLPAILPAPQIQGMGTEGGSFNRAVNNQS